MKISKDVSPGNVPRLSASPSAVSILLPARFSSNTSRYWRPPK
jgi:hypothetical protein